MKKRQVMSLVLAGVMAVSLTACGGGTGGTADKAESGQTEAGKAEASSNPGRAYRFAG